MLNSDEIVNIYKALGVTIGTEEDSKAPNMSKLRYHKIVIMTDADVDGAHIATLLMTFFYRRMRPIMRQRLSFISRLRRFYKCPQREEECRGILLDRPAGTTLCR